MRIGIQGDKGSYNEQACVAFCKKMNVEKYSIKYLIYSREVLRELHKGSIDFGVFAVKSRSGTVAETAAAMKEYPFEKVDELSLQIDHSLLGMSKFPKPGVKTILGYPQAVREHKSFLSAQYPEAKIVEVADPATAAKEILLGTYPKDTLLIAPKTSSVPYELSIIEESLPSNKGYVTTFYLVRCPQKS